MHLFDQDTALDYLGGGEFEGRLSKNWSINGNPNGGYLMAVIAGAMCRQSEKKTPVILTANYLLKCDPGPIRVAVAAIASGKRMDRWEGRLLQGGLEKIRAMGTFLNGSAGDPETRYEKQPPAIAPPDQCMQIPRIGEYTLYDQLEARLDPASAGWMENKLADRSEMKGWIRFSDGRPYDALSLMLIMDAFPPPVMVSHGFLAWVPTIEFTVNIRNMPRSEWLKCTFRSDFINNGLVCEDGELWDEGGELIAVSRQIAQFRKR